MDDGGTDETATDLDPDVETTTRADQHSTPPVVP